MLILAIAVGFTIRFNIFVPWGTDSAAYLSQAEALATGRLFAPASVVFWSPWSLDGLVESPLGLRPGPTKGTITGVYPLGYPLLMAVAIRAGGQLSPYVVAPIFLGLLVWCAFQLGAKLSSGWAGVGAAGLTAANPVTLNHAMWPMSDVPAAALWIASLVLSLNPGLGAAAAAGATTALAVMVRPNLAPLGVAIAVSLVAAEGPVRKRIARIALFAVLAAIGPALILWSQSTLYGSAFTPGYQGATGFFSREHIPTNARFYPEMLVQLNSAYVFAGLLMIPLSLWRARRDALARPGAIVAVAAVLIIALNYALYLPYLTFEGWYWLRFMIPAMTVLFVLFAGLVDTIRLWLVQRSRLVAAVMVIPLLFVAAYPRNVLAWMVSVDGSSLRLLLMGRYLHEALPGNATVLTFLQGGAVAFYTGRPIVRLDLLPADKLDTVVDDLRRHGRRPVFVIDHAVDGPFFRDRFKTSKYVRLDWPARAEFLSATMVTYHDPADRDAFYSGDRYPVDLLKWPVTDPHPGAWRVLHVPMESVEMPLPQESRMFMASLQTAYRDVLKRPASASVVDPDVSTIWVQRYLRFRIHGCDHETASVKVFQQIDGQGAQPLCQRPPSVVFPPWNETSAFRRQLEGKFSGRFTSFVDLEGQAVWVQEYVRHRIRCSHRDSVAAVLAQIDGDTPRSCDGPLVQPNDFTEAK